MGRGRHAAAHGEAWAGKGVRRNSGTGDAETDGGQLTVPDEATQQEILHLWQQVISLERRQYEGPRTAAVPRNRGRGVPPSRG